MNAPDYLAAAAALFGTFTWERLLPLVSFVLCFALLYWMLAKAQRSDETFRAADFLREETSGKPSWKRLIGTACFGVHSWYLYVVTVAGKVQFEDVALYVLAWSGSVAVLEGIRIFRGVPPQQQEQPK